MRLPAAIQIWEARCSFCFMAVMAAIRDKAPDKILTMSKAILMVKILSVMSVDITNIRIIPYKTEEKQGNQDSLKNEKRLSDS